MVKKSRGVNRIARGSKRILVIACALCMLTGCAATEAEEENIVLIEKEKEAIINKFGVSLEQLLIDSDEIIEYDKAIDLVDNKNKVKCSIHEIYDDKKIYLSKCSIKGVMTKYSYGEEREVIDNTLKVYLEKSTGVATLNKPVASEEPLYDVYNVDCGKTYSKPFLLDEKSNYVAYTDSDGKTQVKNFISDLLHSLFHFSTLI